MAVFFSSSESKVSFEVGEYQQFPKPKPQAAAAEKKSKPRLKHLSVFLLGVGLLCVLQAVLNIALRLSINDEVCDAGLEETGEEKSRQDKCPQDWLEFGTSCYYISSGRRNWDQSRRDCVQRGADLVIIDSRLEQAFLTGFTGSAWVGMTDRKEEGTWIWVDGTPVDRARLRWAPGQPDNSLRGEDCGSLRTMMNFIGLNDENCSIRIQWFCEKKLSEQNMR